MRRQIDSILQEPVSGIVQRSQRGAVDAWLPMVEIIAGRDADTGNKTVTGTVPAYSELAGGLFQFTDIENVGDNSLRSGFRLALQFDQGAAEIGLQFQRQLLTESGFIIVQRKYAQFYRLGLHRISLDGAAKRMQDGFACRVKNSNVAEVGVYHFCVDSFGQRQFVDGSTGRCFDPVTKGKIFRAHSGCSTDMHQGQD